MKLVRIRSLLPFILAIPLVVLSSFWSSRLIQNNTAPSPLRLHLDRFAHESTQHSLVANDISSSNTEDHNSASVPTNKRKLPVYNPQPGEPFYLLQEPTHHACDGYRGVLHIQSGDQGAAAGTAFFQYVINQIIWAEMYNMLPWIHFNNVSQHVYDPVVHGGVNTTLQIQSGMVIGWKQAFHDRVHRPLPGEEGAYPGAPYPGSQRGRLIPSNYTLLGNGVWESYFEPVSEFRRGDLSCENKALFTMNYEHLSPGINYFAPWAVRSWQYEYLPPHFKRGNKTLHQWFEPMRIKANEVVQKYYRFQPHVLEKVDKVLPENTSCLAMHIRHSDKWGLARRQIPEDEFFPYAESYLANGGTTIYLATDDQNVIDKIRTKWNPEIQKHIRTQGDESVVRSTYQKPVFRIGEHDRTNTEALIDLIAMSRCQFMVHGLSAVTESAIYLNLSLHNQSVNLEDPSHMNAIEFGALVERELQEQRTKA